MRPVTLEAEDVAVEADGAVEVGHLQVDMADLGAGIDRVHAAHLPAPPSRRHRGHPRTVPHMFTRVEQLEERDGEVAAVERVLGGGGGLLIEGPPGIGKTRLLGAARARADGRRVLSARGSELERDFPFAVVRQLLEPVVRDEQFAGAAALAAAGAARRGRRAGRGARRCTGSTG